MALILSLDSGTTSVRCLLYNEKGQQLAMCQQEIHQSYPHAGWVEEDPVEIWDRQIGTVRTLMAQQNLSFSDISCLGITNQRETLIAWERSTGRPVYPAIVWQCRRTEETCRQLDRKSVV